MIERERETIFSKRQNPLEAKSWGRAPSASKHRAAVTVSNGFGQTLSAGDLQTSHAEGEDDVSNPRKREDPDLLCSSCERVREVLFSSPNSFLVWGKSEDEPRRWARACLVLCGDGRVLMASDALEALLSDDAQEIGYLVAARSQASMGNRESSGRRIADGCDCDKPSVGEEAQGQATSSATDSPIERQAAKARSHLEAQMPLSLGHGKHGEGGVEEEDDWPEGGGENRQEGEEEGVGKTRVLVTPLLQDVLPGFSLSLSLSHTCIHTHCLSHTRTRMAGVRTHTCKIGLIKNGVPKVLNFATTHSDALRFQVYICVCKCVCVNVHVHIDTITALIYTCKLYMRTLSPRPPMPASALPLSLAPRHDSKRLNPFFGSSRDPKKTGACRVPRAHLP